MASYLLVRDSDGAILGEVDSAESALRLLDGLGDIRMRNVSLVRIDDNPGEIIGTSSVTRIRPAGFPTRDWRRS
jgi:hypothetical protein